jgi:type VI secretion system secreted protein VgrG
VRLEDAAGAEEIYLHAQKDEKLHTRNDKDQEVRGYEDLLVKKDRQRTVEENQQLSVVLDDASLVEGNQSLQVRGNRTTVTSGSHDESVEGNQAVSVAKNYTASIAQAAMESVGAAKALTIGAGYAINVALAMNEAVGGLKSNEIGAAYVEHVEESRQEMISKDKQMKTAGNSLMRVGGFASYVVGGHEEEVSRRYMSHVKGETAWLAKKINLNAEEFSVVVNGKLALRLDKSGRIQIFGKNVTLDG